MAEEPLVLYDVKDHIGVITFNRPEKMNAHTQEMRRIIQNALLDIKHNADIWLGIITGRGRGFCTGKDLLEKLSPEERDPAVLATNDRYLLQRSINKPIIAAVNGACLAGGAGTALLSDIVIMSDQAYFGWPQVKRGISSVSGPSMLSRMLPRSVAMSYLLRGKFINAEEAVKLNLAHEAVPHDELMEAAYRWADEILVNAPLALQAIKEAERLTESSPLGVRMDVAREIANRVLRSDDSKEGIEAFREKRDPVWTGH
ncbi:MAG: enoyl-CoA hydratase/isomerase family protein [Proteobacteria bacterium]|nr:enoyl-CoA hydratase/isomerase family protein [Pseudomonadota bacterium]